MCNVIYILFHRVYFRCILLLISLKLNILKTGKLLKVKYFIFHYKFPLHSNENWISRLKNDLKINPQISSSRDFGLQLITQDLKNSNCGKEAWCYCHVWFCK